MITTIGMLVFSVQWEMIVEKSIDCLNEFCFTSYQSFLRNMVLLLSMGDCSHTVAVAGSYENKCWISFMMNNKGSIIQLIFYLERLC